MGYRFANNYEATLTSSVGSGDAFISVSTVDALPTLSGADFFVLTLESATSMEIVRVTAVAGNVLTVLRAQEGTSALSYQAGDRVAMRLTAGALDEGFVQEALNDGTAYVRKSEGWVPASHDDLTDTDSADSHPISAVTGLQTALDGKSSTSHDHAGVYDPAGTGASEAAAAVTAHEGAVSEVHTIAQVTDLQAALDLIPQIVYQRDYSVETFEDHTFAVTEGMYKIIGYDLRVFTLTGEATIALRIQENGTLIWTGGAYKNVSIFGNYGNATTATFSSAQNQFELVTFNDVSTPKCSFEATFCVGAGAANGFSGHVQSQNHTDALGPYHISRSCFMDYSASNTVSHFVLFMPDTNKTLQTGHIQIIKYPRT